ncbi:MAG: 2-C-methyl-D-erythritol 4-phosphate cytidylyltransferase [Aliidiomarina sp.]|uniref:2-C-methyl-D-erythritol 4-phosphate cytidylyltransferase n=1 Tax=Aliidiomarina sp. TaxID=1872439 RepID=UPI0025BBAEF3|nr:2-C-methyl-D-erythritol 4-phosphate cytidylyltransferase [Aliidiomarina sp.]MCH8501767.1 2-C-methyl-D-erythritol 4-phosphate cytidylyltransferase [Aliidiomarina sp.]
MIGIIPAAGIGQRMGAEIPKQYLQCCGKTILDQSIFALLQDPRIERVWVALQDEDQWWSTSHFAADSRVQVTLGGATRAQSVLTALHAAQDSGVAATTLAAVHDAARPALAAEVLARLLDAAEGSPESGALLALPVRDTVKQAMTQSAQSSKPVSAQTLDREKLWLAQTPQVFQLGRLIQALEAGLAENAALTDESSALEFCGEKPLLVMGSRQAMKVTDPEDLALVEYYLKQLNRSFI